MGDLLGLGMWFVLQICLMVIGTIATYNYRPDGEWRFVLSPIAGFCFAYWVTWAILKIRDVPTRAKPLLDRARAFWY